MRSLALERQQWMTPYDVPLHVRLAELASARGRSVARSARAPRRAWRWIRRIRSMRATSLRAHAARVRRPCRRARRCCGCWNRRRHSRRRRRLLLRTARAVHHLIRKECRVTLDTSAPESHARPLLDDAELAETVCTPRAARISGRASQGDRRPGRHHRAGADRAVRRRQLPGRRRAGPGEDAADLIRCRAHST